MRNDPPETLRESGSDGAPSVAVAAVLLQERKQDLLLRWERSVQDDPAAPEKRLELALRVEILPLIDEIAFAVGQLARSSGSSACRVDGAGTWLAEDALSEQGALDAALRGFSRFRGVLLDLFFAEAVMPTHLECHAINTTIDAAVAAVTRRMRDVEQQRLTAIRDRFIAILGHDLRNPLNAITLSSSALQRRALPERDLQLVNRVVSGAERMGKMITDLLEFAAARLVPESFVSARQNAVLADLCEEAVEEMRVLHPSRPIILHARDPGPGMWDRHRLLRVLSNLLGNAVAYSPPRSRVIVTVRRQGERMRVAVHNEGAPIDPKMARTIFEPFERGPGVPGKPGGLGLGLFIARQIARAEGGDILVDSSAERGTTFTLELRIVESPEPRSDAS